MRYKLIKKYTWQDILPMTCTRVETLLLREDVDVKVSLQMSDVTDYFAVC